MIAKANGKTYTIVGKGPMSQFESFIMPYTYLTWWLGMPSQKKGKIIIFVKEDVDGIHIQ